MTTSSKALQVWFCRRCRDKHRSEPDIWEDWKKTSTGAWGVILSLKHKCSSNIVLLKGITISEYCRISEILGYCRQIGYSTTEC